MPEKDLIAYAKLKEFPIIPCNLCGSQENLKRQEINRMIAEWDKKHPYRSWNVFGALTRVVPSHLMDPKLHNFADMKVTGQVDPEGDKGFDQDYFDDHLPESLLAAGGLDEDGEEASSTARQDAFTPAQAAASGEQQIVFMSKRRSGQ